jgi:hypothetical protein
MKKEMKELYIEGIATHDGPEPCAGARKDVCEALSRGTRRPAIEPRNHLVRGADAVNLGGRQHRGRRYTRVASGPRAVLEPVHARNLRARDPGGPTIARPPDQRAGRPGKAEAARLG